MRMFLFISPLPIFVKLFPFTSGIRIASPGIVGRYTLAWDSID